MKRRRRKSLVTPQHVLAVLIAICCVMLVYSFFRFSETGSLIQSSVGTVIAPMEKSLNGIGTAFSDLLTRQKTIQALTKENEELKLEAQSLKARINSMENNLAELDDLRELLELREKYPNYAMTAARIISSDAGNWYDIFTIDKGTDDGILVNMNVIADNALVGIVIETGPHHAKVRAITDDVSSISAMNVNSQDLCIVSGNLEYLDSGLLDMELIKADARMTEGDEIVTSYLSEKYLPGLTIGYVSQVTEDDASRLRSAYVTPVADFEHLSSVLVITQLKSDLISED